ncbi:iron-containing alcohol dehydrogenase [Clostridioides mangenotii]|uniref:iron-containing alcohol dehydrogenase n=1 Tax=Metaclostridioides mangenotii TaxID=1540 RepID=UPI001C1211A7|nr:iron-containing alcohol dehydrogenase [Clostridioides mangenotii]MBU5308040.1 iron-containing alcohol dehydrogenase [Clostridioides mangenotii]
MVNFEYFTPTEVFFGRDVENKAGDLIKKGNYKKVLVHFGGSSAKKSGLLDIVYKSLDDAGVDYINLGGVVPNPRLSKVYEGIELCKKEKVDFILAVGGGSVLDSAKAIGFGVTNDGDVWDFFSGKRVPESCLPIGTILTLSATGSEMSNSSVITKDDSGEKRGSNSDYSRCTFALLNPELTFTLPTYQTSSGCVDILMHTLERYFSKNERMELVDEISEGLLRTVIKYAEILMKEPNNYNARAEIMWAGSLSHNDLTGARSAGGDWSCHQLEHELSGMFDVAHGAGLSAIWGSWARYVLEKDPSRFAKLAKNVMRVSSEGKDNKSVAIEGIEAMEDFFRRVEMPTSIKELGIDLTNEQVKELAHNCSFKGKRTIGGFKILDEKDMENIYAMAK